MRRFYHILGCALLKLKENTGLKYFQFIDLKFKLPKKTAYHYMNFLFQLRLFERQYCTDLGLFQSEEAMQLDRTNVRSESFWKSTVTLKIKLFIFF